MATSTEDSIRSALVTAVQGIAVTELGFDETSGNVHSYLLEEEIDEKIADYLGAKVNFEDVIRAWAVQVYASEDFSEAFSSQQGTRLYEIAVEGYYGAHGETPVNTIITHMRKVRKAIFDLNLNLGQRVDRVETMDQLSLDRIRPANVGDEVFKARMVISATRKCVDW